MISTRVAGYTLGDVDVDTVISSLHRRNAFFFPIDTNSGEYELHPLFSQWVMKKAQILSSHEQRLLNARASRWCLRNGLATAAATALANPEVVTHPQTHHSQARYH